MIDGLAAGVRKMACATRPKVSGRRIHLASNIFCTYVLDEWFVWRMATSQGEMYAC